MPPVVNWPVLFGARRYWITGRIDWLEDRAQWEGLRSMGMVESIRQCGGQATSDQRFYLCSIAADARQFARAARCRWGIENQLHWSLDAALGEGQCRIRAGHAADNMATLRHITLNLLKADKTRKRGIKGKQKNAAWGSNYPLSLFKI